MNLFRTITRTIRHAPGLEGAGWLWNRLRKPYQKLLNWSGRGVWVLIGGSCPARMPPEFTGCDHETYETESFKTMGDWLRSHPDALVIDVGSAYGLYSVAALFVSDRVGVVAIDPDLASLKGAQRLCRYASGRRLRVVHGFAADKHQSGMDLSAATAETERRLAASGVSGDPETTGYILIDKNSDTTIPTHSLDGLLAHEPHDRPLLIKMDVEGAELLVLQGARSILKESAPALLISVHRNCLAVFHQSVEDVRDFLSGLGYGIQVLAVDHEEHWWCRKGELKNS